MEPEKLKKCSVFFTAPVINSGAISIYCFFSFEKKIIKTQESEGSIFLPGDSPQN
jgi:hypothetical protein